MKKVFFVWLTYSVAQRLSARPAFYSFTLVTLMLNFLQAGAQCPGAANSTSNATGSNWSTSSHWTPAGSPGCNISVDDRIVEVRTNTTVFSANCPTGLTMSGAFTVLRVVNNSTLTIQGNFNLTNEFICVFVELGSTLIVQGNFNLSGPSPNIVIAGSMQVTGNLVISEEFATLNVTGSLDVTGAINCATGCVAGETSFPVAGNITAGGGCTGNFGPECNNALPIRLLYFDAREQGNKVMITWATVMEENFSRFIIQRSSDGLSFDNLGELPGRGFNIYDIESKYSFEDEAPLLGFNYYRLKAVDLDDSFEYFEVKAVKLSGSKKLAVYPNPSTGEVISFRTNFSPAESDRIIVLNQLGVEIFNDHASTAHNRISFQNTLRPGIYMLRYISKAFEQNARVLVKH